MHTFPSAVLLSSAIATLSGSQLAGDAATTEYVSTQVGERHPISLSDGSMITLNTDSLIKKNADGADLHVEVLRGEVLFSMQPNPRRHLVVTAGNLAIFDTATVFVVRVVDEQIRVTVEEGQVRLSSENLHNVRLGANQQAVADERVNQLVLKRNLRSEAVERQLAWREGHLIFVCERLSDVAREFNRYNLIKIEVDPHVSNVQVGGEFSATDAQGFVDLMPRLEAGIRWERTRNEKGVAVLRLYQGADTRRVSHSYTQCE